MRKSKSQQKWRPPDFTMLSRRSIHFKTGTADGNGSIARLIASYVLIQNHYFSLALVNDQDRDRYIACLEQADAGDLRPLIKLFRAVQRRTFVKVLGMASKVQEAQGLGQIIVAARHALASRKEARV